MEEVKLSPYVDDMILYIENPKDSTQKITRTDKWIQQGSRIQDEHTEIGCISLHRQWNIKKGK